MFFGSEAPVGTEITVSKPTALGNSRDSSEENSEEAVICHCAFGDLSKHCPPYIRWVNITKQLEQLARNKLNWREINLTCQKVTSNISDGAWGRSQHAELLSSPAASQPFLTGPHTHPRVSLWVRGDLCLPQTHTVGTAAHLWHWHRQPLLEAACSAGPALLCPFW